MQGARAHSSKCSSSATPVPRSGGHSGTTPQLEGPLMSVECLRAYQPSGSTGTWVYVDGVGWTYKGGSWPKKKKNPRRGCTSYLVRVGVAVRTALTRKVAQNRETDTCLF